MFQAARHSDVVRTIARPTCCCQYGLSSCHHAFWSVISVLELGQVMTDHLSRRSSSIVAIHHRAALCKPPAIATPHMYMRMLSGTQAEHLLMAGASFSVYCKQLDRC